jgi:hypothetical protein
LSTFDPADETALLFVTPDTIPERGMNKPYEAFSHPSRLAGFRLGTIVGLNSEIGNPAYTALLV